MYKSLVLISVVCLVVIEARPWQYLPEVPGYVPVYIRNGDTPLEEINPELAEAFHALPAGRSAGKHLEASDSLDVPEHPDQPQPDGAVPEQLPSIADNEPEKHLEISNNANSEISVPELVR